jgi:hypothetical protein
MAQPVARALPLGKRHAFSDIGGPFDGLGQTSHLASSGVPV